MFPEETKLELAIHFGDYPPVNIQQAIEAMAHRNSWFTELQSADFFQFAKCCITRGYIHQYPSIIPVLSHYHPYKTILNHNKPIKQMVRWSIKHMKHHRIIVNPWKTVIKPPLVYQRLSATANFKNNHLPLIAPLTVLGDPESQWIQTSPDGTKWNGQRMVNENYGMCFFLI